MERRVEHRHLRHAREGPEAHLDAEQVRGIVQGRERRELAEHRGEPAIVQARGAEADGALRSADVHQRALAAASSRSDRLGARRDLREGAPDGFPRVSQAQLDGTRGVRASRA